jgi:hypothetical protein
MANSSLVSNSGSSTYVFKAAHDICHALHICLGEVLMAPSEGDGSIVVVVVIHERVFIG